MMNSSERLNVIVIAYACEPNKTSEPGVGWNFAKQIAEFADVTVITRSNNHPEIDRCKHSETVQFKYVDFEQGIARLKKVLPMGTQLYYLGWQWLAYLEANKLAKIKKYDLIHHVTFSISWIAPPVFLVNLPLVWGPVGGGDKIPAAFLKELSLKNICREAIYFILKYVSYISPAAFFARNKAKHLFFRSNSARKSFPVVTDDKISIMCETATDQALYEKMLVNVAESEVVFLSVGRMEYWKGFKYGVMAFAEYIKNGGKAKLVLLGAGPEYKEIQSFINSNALNKHIEVKGSVPHDQVEAELKNAHCLLHPSFRDGGSWSIMEAMIYGLPVICLDISGPADMVDEMSGVLVKPISKQQIINDMAQAIDALAKDNNLRNRLSRGAQQRIETNYRWKHRGDVLQEIYFRVAN